MKTEVQAITDSRAKGFVCSLEADDKAASELAIMPVLPSLTKFRATLPRQEVHAGQFCQLMRDEDRY